jgi:hypothetical protein
MKHALIYGKYTRAEWDAIPFAEQQIIDADYYRKQWREQWIKAVKDGFLFKESMGRLQRADGYAQ